LTAKGYVRGEGGVWSRPDSERRPRRLAVSLALGIAAVFILAGIVVICARR